ncbi:hypothetical protein [Mesoaciditoga lauensis]|uniref:hypothetical protein n=1 Tax=Mesoaciditoga lauensis TaxID=1495039 RepID=UPI00056B5D43|nr:hypothetical protein [Mesoaciditoga lauensis]
MSTKYTIGSGELYFGKNFRNVGHLKGGATLTISEETNDLTAGLPAVLLASAKTAENAELKAASAEVSAENLADALGIAIENVGAGTAHIADESDQFASATASINLLHEKVSNVVVKNAPSSEQTEEYVADGTKGAVAGDYKLTYPISAVGDVSQITLDGVAVPIEAKGSALTTSGTLSVEVDPSNGNLQFFEGDGTNANAKNITGALKIIYTPVGTTYTEGTDYTVAWDEGIITRTSGSNIALNTDTFISYDYATATTKKLTFGGEAGLPDPVPMKFVHTKPDGKKITIMFYKAQWVGGLDLSFAESDWVTVPIDIKAVADTTRPKGDQLLSIEAEQ